MTTCVNIIVSYRVAPPPPEKIPCAPQILIFLQPLAHYDLLTTSMVLPFLECHVVGILGIQPSRLASFS